MKKYAIIILLSAILVAFSGLALADKITIQNEVSSEKTQKNAVTSDVQKANSLSSKRMKDKIDADQTNVNSSTGDRMIRYKKFNDGEGEAKTRQ